MGKKVSQPLVVVIDTNVLISCLLFGGYLNRLRELWFIRSIVPLLSKETFAEFRRVLSYPKFKLSDQESQAIIQLEILPYFDVVETLDVIEKTCRDPHDDKFLVLSKSGKASHLITGDNDLLILENFHDTRIITPSDFLKNI